MDLLIEYTNSFEKDFKGFTKTDRNKINKKIDDIGQSFTENPLNIYKHTSQCKLPKDSNSSMYSFHVGKDIRIIATIDSDPIFDQIILTLIKVVKASHLHKAFKSISESLYQNKLRLLGEDE